MPGMAKPKPEIWVVGLLKGGASKTTTTMFLAFALAARGEDLLVCDADYGTQGVTDWGSRVYAEDGELPFHVSQWTPRLGLLVPFVRQQAQQTGATRVLVDVGGETPEVLEQIAVAAKRVITPVAPEQAELGRIPSTAIILQKASAPQSIVLTRVPVPGKGAARKARRDLAAAGYDVLATEIPHHLARYADPWATVPDDLGAYGDLADELLKGDRS
jgi:CobQ/CobB/MinD/ParA nucleotide binding domain